MLIILAFTLILIPDVSAKSKQKSKSKTVKVFILAGQSNMVGHGKVEYGRNPEYTGKNSGLKAEIKGGIGGLRYLATNPKTSKKYKHLLDSNGKWIVRNDAWIYSTAPGKKTGKLTVGFGKGGWFGPEFAFGHLLAEHYKEPVLIIKTAWGGHSLGVNFRPPSSGKPSYKFKEDDLGASYRNMFKIVRDVCDNLGIHFPELKGYKVDIVGFGWHQGWNDHCSKDMTAEYRKNMINFIKDVRKELKAEKLPFVIANTGMTGWKGKGTLCKIQMEIGDPKKTPEFKGTVTSVETRNFKKTKEESPSGFGYHWNHSGESHYLVGEAMGKAMIKLLKK